jgi:hypothetical protein
MPTATRASSTKGAKASAPSNVISITGRRPSARPEPGQADYGLLTVADKATGKGTLYGDFQAYARSIDVMDATTLQGLIAKARVIAALRPDGLWDVDLDEDEPLDALAYGIRNDAVRLGAKL